MCFSAFASFSAGIVLSATGIATLKKVKNKNEIAFASIPLFFGIQQMTEGIVWSSFTLPEVNNIATYIYAIFAHSWWPTFLPFAIMMIEKNKDRKKLLAIPLAFGILISAALLYSIIINHVTSNIYQNCIQYHLVMPTNNNVIFLALYLVSTCGAAFLSSYKKIQFIGIISLILAIISYLFYNFAFASIWCFFCAVLSLLIYKFFASLHSQKTVQ